MKNVIDMSLRRHQLVFNPGSKDFINITLKGMNAFGIYETFMCVPICLLVSGVIKKSELLVFALLQGFGRGGGGGGCLSV